MMRDQRPTTLSPNARDAVDAFGRRLARIAAICELIGEYTPDPLVRNAADGAVEMAEALKADMDQVTRS